MSLDKKRAEIERLQHCVDEAWLALFHDDLAAVRRALTEARWGSA